MGKRPSREQPPAATFQADSSSIAGVPINTALVNLECRALANTRAAGLQRSVSYEERVHRMATHNLACESLPIKALLGGFLPIQLDEMRDVALQDRQETKYVFSAALLCELLGKASAHYRVLAVAAARPLGPCSTVNSTR